MDTPLPDRTVRRIRYDLKLRMCEVMDVQALSPTMRRVVLGGADLAGFESQGFDDHVKLFFPAPGEREPRMPQRGPDGAVLRGPDTPPARDFTPRAYDAAAGTLSIDFALHQAGPATQWARAAKPGDRIGVGGPRGSRLIPTAFDWHLLVGDETALPAIARRLEELPPGSQAVVVACVPGPASVIPLPSRPGVMLHWVHGGPDALLAALDPALRLPGDYHAWVACESAAAKAIRAHLLQHWGARREHLKAAGYWAAGEAGVHTTHED